jgi:hypothetical protein
VTTSRAIQWTGSPQICDLGARPDDRGCRVCNCIWMLDVSRNDELSAAVEVTGGF